MIHLDLASHAPFIAAVLLGVPALVAIRRRERVLSMRERIARENAALLADARLWSRVPNVDGHTGEVRAR